MREKQTKPKGKIELVEVPQSEFNSGMQVFLQYNMSSVHGVGFIKRAERPEHEWKFVCDGGESYIKENDLRKFYRLLVTYEIDGNQVTKYLNTQQWDYAYKNGLIDGNEFDVHEDDTQVVTVSGFGRLYNREDVKNFIRDYHSEFVAALHTNKTPIRDIDEWFNRKTKKK